LGQPHTRGKSKGELTKTLAGKGADGRKLGKKREEKKPRGEGLSSTAGKLSTKASDSSDSDYVAKRSLILRKVIKKRGEASVWLPEYSVQLWASKAFGRRRSIEKGMWINSHSGKRRARKEWKGKNLRRNRRAAERLTAEGG